MEPEMRSYVINLFKMLNKKREILEGIGPDGLLLLSDGFRLLKARSRKGIVVYYLMLDDQIILTFTFLDLVETLFEFNEFEL